MSWTTWIYELWFFSPIWLTIKFLLCPVFSMELLRCPVYAILSFLFCSSGLLEGRNNDIHFYVFSDYVITSLKVDNQQKFPNSYGRETSILTARYHLNAHLFLIGSFLPFHCDTEGTGKMSFRDILELWTVHISLNHKSISSKNIPLY